MNTTTMRTPTIIRAAIPRITCDNAATELRDYSTVGVQGAYVEYKLTPTCAEIAREAHEVSCSPVVTRMRTERS